MPKPAYFEYRQSLVVVHREYHISRTHNRRERRIRWQRSDNIHTILLARLDCRFDDVLLFATEVTTFTGMRVQAANQDARRRNAKLLP